MDHNLGKCKAVKIKMIEACKICETKIPVPDLGSDWWCPKCQQYSIVCLANGLVESESIRSGNFYLCFFPAHKAADIVSVGEGTFGDFKKMKSFDMNELTHEQAVQWSSKLKTYVIFQ